MMLLYLHGMRLILKTKKIKKRFERMNESQRKFQAIKIEPNTMSYEGYILYKERGLTISTNTSSFLYEGKDYGFSKYSITTENKYRIKFFEEHLLFGRHFTIERKFEGKFVEFYRVRVFFRVPLYIKHMKGPWSREINEEMINIYRSLKLNSKKQTLKESETLQVNHYRNIFFKEQSEENEKEIKKLSIENSTLK